jgi:hypothetical protein
VSYAVLPQSFISLLNASLEILCIKKHFTALSRAKEYKKVEKINKRRGEKNE